MKTFVDNDPGYLSWAAAHPDDFVVNTHRTPSAGYLMLHRTQCRTITGAPASGSSWTKDYAKVCGGRDELERWAISEFKRTPQPCGICL